MGEIVSPMGKLTGRREALTPDQQCRAEVFVLELEELLERHGVGFDVEYDHILEEDDVHFVFFGTEGVFDFALDGKKLVTDFVELSRRRKGC